MIRTLSKVLRSSWVVGLVAGLLVALLVLGVRRAGYLESWELQAYDWSLRAASDSPRDESRIVVIGITEQDVQMLGRWPLTDALLAEVLDRLLQYRPRAIGVDIYRSFPVPPGEAAFRSILVRHSNVVMVMKFGGDGQTGVPPPPVLEHSEQVGFTDLLVDQDGMVRRGLLFLDDGHQTAYSFPLRLALLYLRAEGIVPQPDPSNPQHLRLGPTSFPPLEPNVGGYVDMDARGYQTLLGVRGAPPRIPSYPLTALLGGRLDPDTIKDKIVLLGIMAESLPDVFHTPYGSHASAKGALVYGIQVHAQIAGQLLRAALEGQAPLATASEQQEAWWTLLWGLLGGVVGIVSRSIWRFVAFTVSGMILLGGVVQSAFLNGGWIPLVPPGLAWLSSSALVTAYMVSQEKKQRSLLMQLFSRHVSPEIATAIWQQRDQFWDGGRPRSQQLVVTLLFTDLEGFTPTSEKMKPQALMDWVNGYVDRMAQLVMQHGGVVDDYYGDAVKANFGVPLSRTTEIEIREDAINAVTCALAMAAEMKRLNQTWVEQGLPTARMRIGIFTGPVVAGSLGSAQRLKYTTIGDTVNVAARLESFEKESWEPDPADRTCRILLGESTWRYVGTQFQTQRVGEVTLKGKEEVVSVYRVIGRLRGEAAISDRRCEDDSA